MKPQDSVEAVLELMRSTFGADFKEYYDGDPEVIPTFNMPCLIVTQTRDETEEGEMGGDDVSDQIRIKVVYDKRDDFDGSRVNPVDLTEKKIRRIIAARDEQGKYSEKSIKGALRSALLEGVEAVAPSMTIEYGINPRETLGSSDNVPLTAEGHVTFSIQYSVDTY